MRDIMQTKLWEWVDGGMMKYGLNSLSILHPNKLSKEPVYFIFLHVILKISDLV